MVPSISFEYSIFPLIFCLCRTWVFSCILVTFFVTIFSRGLDDPALWASKIGNSWRTTDDIVDTWERFSTLLTLIHFLFFCQIFYDCWNIFYFHISISVMFMFQGISSWQVVVYINFTLCFTKTETNCSLPITDNIFMVRVITWHCEDCINMERNQEIKKEFGRHIEVDNSTIFFCSCNIGHQ